MSAPRRHAVVRAVCPRCGGASLRANDIGAWCDNYPCRWSIKRSAAAAAAALLRKVWPHEPQA